MRGEVTLAAMYITSACDRVRIVTHITTSCASASASILLGVHEHHGLVREQGSLTVVGTGLGLSKHPLREP